MINNGKSSLFDRIFLFVMHSIFPPFNSKNPRGLLGNLSILKSTHGHVTFAAMRILLDLTGWRYHTSLLPALPVYHLTQEPWWKRFSKMHVITGTHLRLPGTIGQSVLPAPTGFFSRISYAGKKRKLIKSLGPSVMIEVDKLDFSGNAKHMVYLT